jgi:hypothetical protein
VSELRQVFSNFLLRKQGKTIKIELFKADQWRLNCLNTRLCNPRPPISLSVNDLREWQKDRFRLRINMIWYRIDKEKYSFLNAEQIKKFLSSKLDFLIIEKEN